MQNRGLSTPPYLSLACPQARLPTNRPMGRDSPQCNILLRQEVTARLIRMATHNYKTRQGENLFFSNKAYVLECKSLDHNARVNTLY